MKTCLWWILIIVAALAAATKSKDGEARDEVPRTALQYQRDLVRTARAVWGLDAPVAALAGQVHQESGWRPDARSAYASGLAQFTPATSEWISKTYTQDLGENQPLNPGWALRALARYMFHLYERVKPFATDCDRYAFALSDYNGGPGWRMKRQRLALVPGDYATTSHINPGIRESNQAENEHYPRAILLRWQVLYTQWGRGINCKGVLI